MSVNLTINGITYAYPQPGDKNWGSAATNWASAVTSGMLQKAGGSFPLTNTVDFGGSFGIKLLTLTTETANPSSTGFIRLANSDTIDWRNAANSGDLALSVDGGNRLVFNGNVVNTLTIPVAVGNGGTGDTTLSAYSVLCGGTTATNPVQSVSGLGLAGQALTSNGASALPTWQNVAGSGTVNNGTTGQIAYYASSSNVISSLTDLSYTSPVLTLNSGFAQTLLHITSAGINSAVLQLTGNGLTTTLSSDSTGGFAITDIDNSHTILSYARSGTLLTINGAVDVASHQIHNVTDPSTAQDAATKNYVATQLAIAPTAQSFTSGSGTYTTPTNPSPLYLKIRLVGGGGGGSGGGQFIGGTQGGNGSDGNNTTFGSLVAGKGLGGFFATIGGFGGSNTTSGIVLIDVNGGNGESTDQASGSGTTGVPGLSGGGNPLGSGSKGQISSAAGVGGLPRTGEGGQGGGANATSRIPGSGGGAGGYMEVIFTSPSATYSYAVGAGGAGGTAGTNSFAGGSGGSGYIVVEEYYH